MPTKSFLDILKEKVVVFDGAMGTNLQALNLTVDDYGGEQYCGCNEYLVFTLPSAIERIHADFLSAGCDVIETNTFGGTSIVLAEYNLVAQSYLLNYKAASLAKKVVREFSTPSSPRFVAGSMGPTTKLPSLGHITFKEMEVAYYEQAKGLVEGGVDILIVETCQDILQVKAALAGIFSFFIDAKRRVPVIVSVTIEPTGKMLLGTEISAALTSLEVYEINAIGINCATGPKEMSENVRYLCANSPMPVLVMPNAGIPENVAGQPHYTLTSDEFVYHLSRFVKELGVNIVGGCCGTTKEHIKKLVDAVSNCTPTERKWEFTHGCSSVYQSVPFKIDQPPVLIGERTNANGSKLFRELLAKEDWEGMVAIGRDQVKEGAHILDVCTASVGRDEAKDMQELISRFNTQVSVPLMIDSTEPQVIELALQRIAGKAIVNSINLEDGGVRAGKILSLCKKYGAAVVCLTIDENGMAKTAQSKFNVAKRIYELATKKYNVKEENLIFDTLTFTLSSGGEEFSGAGIETLEAIRLIKKNYPRVSTSLGISNISYGFAPHARQVLNSVFLHYALEYGIDMAIVHPSKILPLYEISEEERELCRKLIFNEKSENYDPLKVFSTYYADKKNRVKKKTVEAKSLEERLKNRIIEGNKVGLNDDLRNALKKYKALDVVNDILLEGMKIVSELFSSGQMQLPFVLQSAEVMKSALAFLEANTERPEFMNKGSIVLATVRGDMHDIGKNLVNIILTNNGYKVYDLGVNCSIENILKTAVMRRTDAIGMSGLLVKSTQVMKENLEIMAEQGLTIPVVIGGAALSRRYVEQHLQPIYKGALVYAKDAIDGLRFMEDILSEKKEKQTLKKMYRSPHQIMTKACDEGKQIDAWGSSLTVEPTEFIPMPPFYGSKVVTNVSLDEIFQYINETTLFRGQWKVLKRNMSEEEYRTLIDERVYPDFKRLKSEVKRDNLLEPKVVYGYFPCQSDGDDLIIYKPKDERNPNGVWQLNPISDPESNSWRNLKLLQEWMRFSFPRQKRGSRLCISDFFASKVSGKIDVVAFYLVTMGRVASEYSKKLFLSSNYREYLYFHGLSVEAVEALAELWHKKIREELNIHHQDAKEIKGLFNHGYQGTRFSFGYPACPSLEDHFKLFELLRPERIGVELTEEYQLVPEQSTDALIVHHPESRYFNL